MWIIMEMMKLNEKNKRTGLIKYTWNYGHDYDYIRG